MLARNTADHNWPDIENETGVYFFDSERPAIEWALYSQSMNDEQPDRIVLIIDIPDDSEVFCDEVYTNRAFYVKHDIPASAIADFYYVAGERVYR